VRLRLATLLAPIFAITGFSALALQVVWQRVISLHSGVDLSSKTTVVAAFLAGLGVGSLIGGALGDRLSARRALILFGAANVAIAVYAFVSTWLLYDLYARVAPHLEGALASFAFNTTLLAIPTTLMGLSLPLVAKAASPHLDDAGPRIGMLYGVNTVGAAAGAAVTGWFLLGTLGFTATARLAGALNLVAAAAIVVVARSLGAADAVVERPDPPPSPIAVWPWIVLYGLTGAIALGFEQVFFRLIDAGMQSNSYSFAHVLTIYLALFGAGAALGARRVRRAIDPRRTFLWLQLGVAVCALATIAIAVHLMPRLGLRDELARYFSSEGYSGEFGSLATAGARFRVVAVFLLGPLAVMGPPVLLMGSSYPFMQAVVSDRSGSLSRRTGALLFANTMGNVTGTVVTGYVLIDRIGTARTARLLAGLLGGIATVGLVAMLRTRETRETRWTARVIAAAVVLVAALAFFPSNQHLWAFLHGTSDDRLVLAEDRACAAAIRFDGDLATMLVNASIQNSHPFDDFHVLIGLMPSLAQAEPKRALAIGFGAGSTTYGMLVDSRIDRVESVELCGTQYDLIERLANEPARPEFGWISTDPRHIAITGDGRKHLLRGSTTYDVIAVDTLRSTSAYSGSLYSKEFYERVRSRLAPSGVVAQWVPTPRVLMTVAEVFPYVVTLQVDTYNGSTFFLASPSPIEDERQVLLDRFASTDPDAFAGGQRESLEHFLAAAPRNCVVDGTPLPGGSSTKENTDLRPRDEYFLNNRPPAPLTARAC
jgi:spermidine synthase/MFS family permease